MVRQLVGILAWVYMGVVGVGFLLYGLLYFLLWLLEPFELWWQARREARVDYARYAALRDIRDIRRRAIHDLLAAEREYHRTNGAAEVIEGTAVETRN